MKKILIALMVFLFFYSGSRMEAYAAESYYWPVPSCQTVTSGRGYSSSHDAIDIPAGIGSPVYATKSGTIKHFFNSCGHQNSGSGHNCNNSWGSGNGLYILHDDGTWAEYAHMQLNSFPGYIYVGARVTQGQYLGNTGSSGGAQGPHLHFGIKKGDTSSFWNSAGVNNNPNVISYVYDYTPNGGQTIQLWAIADGETIRGVKKIWAKRTDSDSNHYAIFYLDGVAITGYLTADSDGFFSCIIDSSWYDEGNHTIAIKYANTQSSWKHSINVNFEKKVQLWDVEEGKIVSVAQYLSAKRYDSDSNHYAEFYLDDNSITGYLSADVNNLFSVWIDPNSYAEGAHQLKVKYANTNGSWTSARTINIKHIQKVEGISLSNSSLSLRVSEISTLNVTITPSTAENKDVTWSSSNTSIATVSTNGVVTAVGKGSATITAAAQDGSGVKASCTVTVVQPVTGISFTDSSLVLKVGGTSTLNAVVSPTTASNTTLKWSSSNTSVVTVNSSGVVMAVGVGNATITATAQDGSDIKASCTVTVEASGNDDTSGEIPDDSQEAKVRSFVERMYTVALGRETDQSGVSYWTNQLLSFADDGATVARGFLLGNEINSRNYSDSEYVQVLYKTFFDRDADAGGKSYWCDLLGDGATRAQVLAGFVNSNEFFNLCADYEISRGMLRGDGSAVNPGIYRFGERLYSIILERAGDKNGIEYWIDLIDTGVSSPEEVAINFFWSDEYLAKSTSNNKYIQTLYRMFMDRQADAAGFTYWNNVLNSGTDRLTVLRGFADSMEFKVIMAEYGL